MTPEERYRELREMSEGFTKKKFIHFHMVRTIKEAVAEARAEIPGLVAVATAADAYRREVQNPVPDLALRAHLRDRLFQALDASLKNAPEIV